LTINLSSLLLFTLVMIMNLLIKSPYFAAQLPNWLNILPFLVLFRVCMKLNFWLHLFFPFFLTDGKGNSSTGQKDEQSLSKEPAVAVLSVAFNAISVRYITRGQLSSASKTLKLGLKTTLSKEEYVIPVATALIKQGFIKIEPSEKVTREDVSKLKSF